MVHLLDDEVTKQFFAHIEDFHVQRVSDAELGSAQADVKERTAEVETLAAIVPKHPSAIAAHQAALEAAEEALAGAEDRLHDLTTAAQADGPNIRELRAEWPSFTLAEHREVLRAAIEAVSVRRGPHPGAKVATADRIRVVFRS
jgi:chromosome segregation ATPase